MLCITICGAVLHSKSSKQNLNSKSSTESEIIGVSDYLPYALWMGYFLEHQGYKLKENLVHQDNQSSIKMDVNGRNSYTGNSRHVKVRYFFTKDLVDKKEIRIEYCPSERMLSDYITKPLQGKLFHIFRSVIMGWEPISTLNKVVLPSKERVDQCKNFKGVDDTTPQSFIEDGQAIIAEQKHVTCNHVN